jgi:hypothetical protein
MKLPEGPPLQMDDGSEQLPELDTSVTAVPSARVLDSAV